MGQDHPCAWRNRLTPPERLGLRQPTQLITTSTRKMGHVGEVPQLSPSLQSQLHCQRRYAESSALPAQSQCPEGAGKMRPGETCLAMVSPRSGVARGSRFSPVTGHLVPGRSPTAAWPLICLAASLVRCSSAPARPVSGRLHGPGTLGHCHQVALRSGHAGAASAEGNMSFSGCSLVKPLVYLRSGTLMACDPAQFSLPLAWRGHWLLAQPSIATGPCTEVLWRGAGLPALLLESSTATGVGPHPWIP